LFTRANTFLQESVEVQEGGFVPISVSQSPHTLNVLAYHSTQMTPVTRQRSERFQGLIRVGSHQCTCNRSDRAAFILSLQMLQWMATENVLGDEPIQKVFDKLRLPNHEASRALLCALADPCAK